MTEATGVRPDAETWSVVILYEDKPTRDRAMALCDRLVQRFWSEVEFSFHWWRTDFLIDPRMAQTADADAADADIFIFSPSPTTSLSPILLRWFDGWSPRRQSREGMFLDLTQAAAQQYPIVQQKQACLRALASNAGLEYFNRLPPSFGEGAPNSLQDVETRANQLTTVLDDILTRIPPPPHFGLNE